MRVDVMIMGLREDAKAQLGEILGGDAAEQVLRNFDNPQKYPADFLEEHLFFMKKMLGEEAAQRKVTPLYVKYPLRQAIN